VYSVVVSIYVSSVFTYVVGKRMGGLGVKLVYFETHVIKRVKFI
jgi:hypothetical protein